MDDSGEARRRREQAYRNLLDRIRDRALRFLQIAPAKEGRRELELMTYKPAVTACEPEICSIEMVIRNDLIIVRCHTCKRGGTWRVPGRVD
jgi:hypothetical protein